MVDENKIYDSRITQRQYPLEKLEMIIDQLIDIKSEVEFEARKGKISVNRDNMLKLYSNVLTRTQDIVSEQKVYSMDDNITPEMQCQKITEYIKILADKNIYSIGSEEVKL